MENDGLNRLFVSNKSDYFYDKINKIIIIYNVKICIYFT